MSSAAPVQQAKLDAAHTAQHTSQLATQHQQSSASAVQSEFTDLRTQAIAQRQLQYAADCSPQSRQLKSFPQMAQNSARATQLKVMSAMMSAPAAQRVEDDEALQMKAAGETARREAATDATKAPKLNNTGLPDNLKSGIESLSGKSMDHVKVHYNSSQPAQLNAHAYAQGSAIHVAPGQEQHLPHEAWHVVQQAQGRVQPTMQMKDGVPVNDDVGLEREADVMGARAAVVGHHAVPSRLVQVRAESAGAQAQRKLINGQSEKGPLNFLSTAPAQPVAQAMISVGDFKTATYGLGKRRQSIGPVNIALATYIGASTILNALALWNAANTYLHAGNHAVNRVLAVTALRDSADEEHRLLTRIGNPNAHLLDALLAQAAGFINPLMVLAAAVTPGQANTLPALITAIGGAANIGALNGQQLVAHITPAQVPLLTQLFPLVGGIGQLADLDAAVQAAGAAHAPLLSTMITQSGGQAQLAALTLIMQRHAGQGNLAFDLTREAAGNAALFARLAAEVPFFLRTGLPGVLPGLAAGVAAYNGVQLTLLSNQMATFIAHARLVHTAGTDFGAHGNQLVALDGRLNNLQPRVGVLAGAGGAKAANDKTWINQAAGRAAQIGGALPGLVAGAALPLTPAQQISDANYAAAIIDAAAAALLAVATFDALLIGNTEDNHFVSRHTAHYFNFGEIKPANTLWPVAWGGASDANVGAQVAHVLGALAAVPTWLNSGAPIPNQAVLAPPGGTARIAGLAGGPGVLDLGQFFPENNPGAGIHPYSDAIMRAILSVL